MDVEQLNYFIVVARYEHFSLAAEQLCISQSALSKHIRALESELGVALFDRCGRTVHITSAGQDFLSFAKETVTSYAKLKKNLNQYNSTHQGHLRIGTIPMMTQYGLQTILSSFLKQHNDISIEIIEDRDERILDILNEAQIDFAFVHSNILPDNTYKTMTLIDDVMVLVVHNDHPLAQRPALQLSELSNQNLIVPGKEISLQNLTFQSCSRAFLESNIRFEKINMQTAIGFVAENMGISLLPRKAAEYLKNSQVTFVPLRDLMKSKIALVFPHGKKLSPSAAVLKEYTVRCFKNNELY